MTAPVTFGEQDKAAILLAALRCARIRVTLLGLEIEEVGVAVKYHMISPEVAVGWLHDIGALQYINPEVAAIPEAA
jgi:hypothetical protein